MDNQDKEAKDNVVYSQLTKDILAGKLAVSTLEFLEKHIGQLQVNVDSFIYSKMAVGSPTSDELLRAYTEKYAYEKILQTLRQKVRSGNSSGDKMQKMTENSNGKERRAATYSTYSGLG